MEYLSLENKLFTTLFFAAVLHSLYLAVLLFFKSRKEQGLAWLGLMMVPVAFELLTYLLYLTQIIKFYPHLYGAFVPILYLLGPTYYFFILRSSNPNRSYKWFDILHLLPILYVFWEWLPVFTTWTIESKLAMIEYAYTIKKPALSNIFWANRRLYFVFGYILFAYFYLKKQNKINLSNQNRINWLQRFSLVFGGLLILKLSLMVLFWTIGGNGSTLELLFILIIALAIHYLGYVVLGKDKVLPEIIRPKSNGKYASSPLDESQIAINQQKILSYLKADKPWLNPDFSIQQLSEKLAIPRHHLSQILSEGLLTNFTDLINQFRITEVKRRLEAGAAQKFSIMGIATDCGFGSKSSFNRIFKKITGMTPSAYLDSLSKIEKAKN